MLTEISPLWKCQNNGRFPNIILSDPAWWATVKPILAHIYSSYLPSSPKASLFWGMYFIKQCDHFLRKGCRILYTIYIQDVWISDLHSSTRILYIWYNNSIVACIEYRCNMFVRLSLQASGDHEIDVEDEYYFGNSHKVTIYFKFLLDRLTLILLWYHTLNCIKVHIRKLHIFALHY